jgi:hypothetical protein
MVQPCIHKVRYGRLEESCEVGLETTDLDENCQKDKLVRWELVQDVFALIQHVRRS